MNLNQDYISEDKVTSDMHIFTKSNVQTMTSDSDYNNSWITRKQSLGYIRIALSFPAKNCVCQITS